MEDQTIGLAHSRTVGFVDYRTPAATAVLWCHGGPGSRLEPAHLGPQARQAGLRIIGIDRPGYGLSTPQPGRTIAGWVPDALAVADHLGVGQFVTVGTSTGGAFALALAALAPERVLGVVACCSMTDTRWPEGRSTMSRAHAHAVWDAPDRAAALAAAVDAHGEGGSKMRGPGMAAGLAPSDLALFRDPHTPSTPLNSSRTRNWSSSMTSATSASRPKSCPSSATCCAASSAHPRPRRTALVNGGWPQISQSLCIGPDHASVTGSPRRIAPPAITSA